MSGRTQQALHSIAAVKQRIQHYEPPLLDSSTLEAFHKSLSAIAVCPRREEQLVRPLWRRLRILLFDVPCILLFILWNSTQFLLMFHDNYVAPQLNLLRWSDERAEKESTYYHRICTVHDATATHPEELLVDSTMPTSEIVRSMSRHGVVVFPDLLSRETAKALRETIVEHNTIEENFGVLSNEHRYSYGIRMEQDPIVRQAVHEISTNPTLAAALEGILGVDPALCKFHAITSTEGAADQNFHWDVMASTSAVGFSRSFAPLYSLFIPLQDTTKSMGPTDLCPGSHVCSGGNNFCEETAFQLLMDSPHATEPVWPATYGALMNQQTTHRGRAHMGGPDRVLFTIAVTPRPRFDHVSLLETRALSMGGSFAMHRSQWGHTWSDLNSGTMYNPIKMLRSLGVYKPSSAKWGREWLMVFLARMANGSNLGAVSLREFIAAGGMKFVPKHLHGEIGHDGNTIWYDFFLETFRNISKQTSFYLLTFAASCICLAISFELTVAVVERRGFFPMLRRTRNYLFCVSLVLLLVFECRALLQKMVALKPWARHLQNGKLYALPHSFQGPKTPSTLPLEQDILMLDDFQSDYLASYTEIYNVGHPGNAHFRARIEHSAGGYDKLPSNLRRKQRDDILSWLQNEKRARFLQKNDMNQWSEMDENASRLFVQKELLRHSRVAMEVLFRELAYRRSELKFGTWRDSALARTHTIKLLKTLEDCFIEEIGVSETSTASGTSSRFHLASKLPTVKVTNAENIVPNETKEQSGNAVAEEPFSGAWLQVGDRVDALYDESDPYWYPGTIVGALAHTNHWVVSFDNYVGEREVCRYCATRLKPLLEGETIEVSKQGRFSLATVVSVASDGLEVATKNPPSVRTKFPLTKYRRLTRPHNAFTTTRYNIGTPVFSAYYDSHGKSSGVRHAAVIVSHNQISDTYGVAYADGYKSSGLHPYDLRPMHF